MKAKRILASVLSVALLLQLSPLGVLALDESLPQTPQVSTVQENLDPVPTEEPAPTAEPIPEETAVPMAAPTQSPRQSLPPHRRRSLRRTLRKRLPRSRLRNPRQPLTPRQPCRR